ncbi:MAG: UbiA family prenyltransferase [Candidatus Moranbacteria bacterium]|nr:UbiA family prenyltransferase [Candidatus Moranbacteria bacterium]
MSNFIKNFLENDKPLSIQKVAASLFALVLMRTFLEFFSNPDPSGFIFGWETTYLHFPLFYFLLFLFFTLILLLLTRKTIDRIWNFLLPSFILILLPPVIDLFSKDNQVTAISYIATEPQNFISLFFKFPQFSTQPGITMGIQITAFLILSLLGLFILKNTSNIFKSAIGVLSGYLFLFFCAIIPSIVALPYIWQNQIDSAEKLYNLALNSGLIQVTRQALPLSLTTTNQQAFFHAIFMAQAFWLLIVIQLFFIFILPNLKYRKMLLENFPYTRIIYWTFIALIGIYLSQKTFVTVELTNFTTLVSFATIFLLGVLNTLFAVCINDIEDIKIDIISNSKRPLANNDVSLSQWKNFSYVLLILIVLGLATINVAVIFFFILTQMAYYIYSARPLRLKRHFVSSSIIIGLASVTVAMAGFFFVSADQHIAAFPLRAIFIIGFVFAIFSNMKDIKDYAGDKQEHMQTMPVVFGLENSKKIIALLYAIVFISLPFLINTPSLLFFSVLCTFFTTYLFTKKQYQEKYIFLVLFFYATMLFLTII